MTSGLHWIVKKRRFLAAKQYEIDQIWSEIFQLRPELSTTPICTWIIGKKKWFYVASDTCSLVKLSVPLNIRVKMLNWCQFATALFMADFFRHFFFICQKFVSWLQISTKINCDMIWIFSIRHVLEVITH